MYMMYNKLDYINLLIQHSDGLEIKLEYVDQINPHAFSVIKAYTF